MWVGSSYLYKSSKLILSCAHSVQSIPILLHSTACPDNANGTGHTSIQLGMQASPKSLQPLKHTFNNHSAATQSVVKFPFVWVIDGGVRLYESIQSEYAGSPKITFGTETPHKTTSLLENKVLSSPFKYNSNLLAS